MRLRFIASVLGVRLATVAVAIAVAIAIAIAAVVAVAIAVVVCRALYFGYNIGLFSGLFFNVLGAFHSLFCHYYHLDISLAELNEKM